MPPKKEEISYFSIKKEIEQKQFRPIYVLQGEEPYYIDKLCDLIVDNALSEDEKAFNLTVCYGVDVEMRNVIAACKQYPAMSQYQVVVLREAQNVGKAGNKHATEINMLQYYAQKPLDSTILVICYKGGSIKAGDFTKELKKTTGLVFTSNKIRDYEIPKLIREYCRSISVNIDEKSVAMLAEHIGSDLSRLFSEIDKLRLLTGPQKTITPELIERNIGYSKEFNIFELEDALVSRNQLKAFRIVDYFQRNPKNNPVMPVVSSLFNFFSNILLIQTAKDRTDAGLMEQVNIRTPFRIRKLKEAAMAFSKRGCVNIISYLRDCDVKSKGQGSRQDPYDLLKELIYKILHS
ncbi:MAG: DNA polymerase III subunit delta [Bacteroidales bacterium]|nr:DNA polymerase III subunit delta [Bacteroidales bacterium]